jgi:hypothetical protein
VLTRRRRLLRFFVVRAHVPESEEHGVPRVVVFGASQRQQQILRSAYPIADCVVKGAPNVPKLRMTPQWGDRD